MMRSPRMYRSLLLLSVLVFSVTCWSFNPAWSADPDTKDPRTTAFPATLHPDQICLTWSDNPQNTQTIQWRTAKSVKEGRVQIKEKGQAAIIEVKAKRSTILDLPLKNDPRNRRFTAVATNLRPGTGYDYRVGSKTDNTWSEWNEFTTAPDKTAPFSFVYMGDPQVGMETWGKLLEASLAQHPKTAFYLIAGDTINKGNSRDQWDAFFNAAKDVFDQRPVAPTLGNHDYGREHNPRLYLQLFGLPEKTAPFLPKERNYCFRYGNALFVVLDSNQPTKRQAKWLENQLANTDATWKFALYHHPAYSSKGNRDNTEVRKLWMPLFDKYHLDMALQGHDHAYLRTYPMKADHRVESPKDGTVYVVSVSGTKLYDQDPHDYTQVGLTKVSLYQTIDIDTNPNRLTYRAYDIKGEVKDELVIEK